jgi:hypothetical protein
MAQLNKAGACRQHFSTAKQADFEQPTDRLPEGI